MILWHRLNESGRDDERIMDTMVEVSELFERLAERLNTKEAAKLDRIIQWQITDHDPGIWALKISGGVGELIVGGVENPDITFVTEAEVWVGIAEGRLDPMRQFMSGKLKVKGDMMFALKVPNLFPTGESGDFHDHGEIISQQDQAPVDEVERERQARIAELTDPATFRYLTGVGVSEGWRCAEVGAGTGTVAIWLADQVGESGHVDAIDIDISFLRNLEHPRMTVVEQDVTKTPLEPGRYDLIHAKTLLQHVAERDRVLREFAEALRPGGYLVIEDADIRSIQRVEPPSPLLTRAAAALETFFYFSGADPAYPMRLMPEVRKVGLEVLGTDSQVTVVQAGTDAIETVRMSLEKLAPMIVKAGLMGQVEIDKALKLLADDGETMIYTPTTIAVWARRPGA